MDADPIVTHLVCWEVMTLAGYLDSDTTGSPVEGWPGITSDDSWLYNYVNQRPNKQNSI